MKKVLIVTYLQRHLKKMLPVIQELEKDKEVSSTLLLLTEDEKKLAEKNSICFKMLDEYTDKKRRYDFDLDWALEPLINAIDIIQPDLFCAIEVNYILRNAVRYCRQFGIKTVIIQHGTPNVNSLHAFLPFEGNLFLAWGQFTKDFLVKHGMKEEKVVLTGGIPFDRTLTLVPDFNNIARELGISINKKWIVFTTQAIGAGNRPTAKEIDTGVSETARFFIDKPDYELIFQVHPSQEEYYIRDIVDKVDGSRAKVCKYHDTEELMKASFGVITFFSTTAIDAILLRKPLLLINLSVEPDYFPFVDMGVAIGAYTKNQINDGLQQLISGLSVDHKKFDTAANYMNYMNDNNALFRVMDVINNVLNSVDK